MRRLDLLVPLALLLASASASAAAAQAPAPAGSPEVIRGLVTNDSGRVLPAATVIVTRGPDRLVRQTTTDSAGNYAIRFDPGTGDYLVYVSAPTYRAARRRVQREGNASTRQGELLANFVLSPDVAMIAAMRVTAQRPVRAALPNPRGNAPETGAAERFAEGVSGQLPPSVAGDLSALAGTIPGVTVTPSGPAILGAGAESNLATLNGLGLGAANIPRAVRTETRVAGATYDVTRGGFSGANIDTRLGPGSREYQRRNAFLTVDPSALQFTGEAGRGIGARRNGLRGSFGADGELIRRALTYNVGLDLSRATTDATTLFAADRAALLPAGIAPDSVERLAAVAVPLGLPGTRLGASPVQTGITWLGRLDDTRDTLQTRAFTSYFSRTQDDALGASPLMAASALGTRASTSWGGQLHWRLLVGPERRIVTESRASLSRVTNAGSSLALLPGATVLVRSQADETTKADVARVALGGAPAFASSDRRWTLEGANETAFYARGNRHRFRTLLWGRYDDLALESGGNRLGTFSFNSIGDLAAGRPASFSRTLAQPDRSGSAWNAATAVAHEWVPSRHASILYGLRVEANGLGAAPERNPGLEEALGVRTGFAPTRLHVSPRVGFMRVFNRNRDNGSGTNMSNVGTFYRTMSGMLRGGVGEFRDLLRPNAVADAGAATGLAGGTTTLWCVGAAVPTVDWAGFASDPNSIPTACADGAGPLAERAPSAVLIGEDYDSPRSWRASLDYLTNVGKWMVRANALGSYDLNQPGTVDANFAGVPRFTLDDEGGRPVFVGEGSIDPASGAVSAADGRRSAAYGRVDVRRSDLRGYGGLLTLGIQPDVFRRESRWDLFTSFNYTLQATRRQFRGFDGAGFGDPRTREWAPSANDARHAVVLSGGGYHRRVGTITLFGRLQSGLPFTPIVQGDPNGDGRFGDRAFIAGVPAADGPDPLAELRQDGSPTARACLARFTGQVADRNGCRGPWTQTLNVQWVPPIPRRWQRRVTTTVYLQNVLGGVDQLLHGSNGLRGWGTQAAPDPVLYVPRGFDPAAQAFRYDVNPRFGETRPARSLVRSPFRLSIDFSMDLSVAYPLQQLRRALEPVRTPGGGWERRGADSTAAFYLQRTSSVHKLLQSESDSLLLTSDQLARLRAADSVYSAQVRAIYVPLGAFLAATQTSEPGKAQLDSVEAADKAYWKIFWRQPEIAGEILTPLQKSLMPTLQNMLAIPMARRENSRWMFGNAVTLSSSPPPAPAPRGR